MAAKLNGGELVKKLAESGTPPDALAPARRCLADTWAAAKRVATAAEVLGALADAHGPDHGTVAKARSIAEAGEWQPPAVAAVATEDEVLEAAKKVESLSQPATRK